MATKKPYQIKGLAVTEQQPLFTLQLLDSLAKLRAQLFILRAQLFILSQRLRRLRGLIHLISFVHHGFSLAQVRGKVKGKNGDGKKKMATKKPNRIKGLGRHKPL